MALRTAIAGKKRARTPASATLERDIRYAMEAGYRVLIRSPAGREYIIEPEKGKDT